jgi:hypothetical protein
VVPFEAPITYIYETDTELFKLYKYIYPKPQVFPYIDHPFAISTDYPTIKRILYGRPKKIGNYKVPKAPWTSRPKHLRIPKYDDAYARMWLFDTLKKNWLSMEHQV